jgi:ribonuclease P protein component
VSNSRYRLRNSGEFDSVFKGNRYRVSSPAFLFLAIENNLDCSRLGMVIGKKNVKLATRRSRVKRALRESFRQNFKVSALAIDLVVVARGGIQIHDKIQMNEQIAFLMLKLQKKLDDAPHV